MYNLNENITPANSSSNMLGILTTKNNPDFFPIGTERPV
jgi:hypothetical protein